ncbi:bifunctional DNA primase/polymerase [Pseudonocardia sp. NPDC049154]|uniref:bifunctional DNA primase/polymerase n=1 Tax=Pseudonocardia sp. NPDC049154 TaxID=3155501 RepID=UPI0033CEE5AF
MDAVELVTSYINMGIAVFPLYGVGEDGRCQCGRDCPSPAKHPRLGLAHRKDDPRRATCRGECGMLGHGLHDATTDPGQVAEWLAAFPTANWAVRPPVGVLVLDEDPRNGGDVELAKLEERHGALPATLTARTGSGGRHIWLSYNGPARGKLCAGVDCKTNTGYLVAPPSRHISGGTYEWVDQHAAAYAPQWVKDIMNPPVRLRPQPRTRADLTRVGKGLVDYVLGKAFGEVNDAVYWAACRADQHGILDDILEDLVQAAGHAAGAQASHAGEMQTRRTIESARRRPNDATRRVRRTLPTVDEFMGVRAGKAGA